MREREEERTMMKGSDAAEREREAFRRNGNKCREKKESERRGRDGRMRAGLSMKREKKVRREINSKHHRLHPAEQTPTQQQLLLKSVQIIAHLITRLLIRFAVSLRRLLKYFLGFKVTIAQKKKSEDVMLGFHDSTTGIILFIV